MSMKVEWDEHNKTQLWKNTQMDTTKNAILCHLSSVPYPVNLSPSKKSLQPSWVFFLAPGEKPKYIKVKHLDSMEMVTFCFLLVTS